MWFLLIIRRMRTLTSKYTVLLLFWLLPLGAAAQLHDMYTSPLIEKDLPKLTLRLTQLAAGEIASTEAQLFETSSIEEWAIYSDSLQQGLRSLAEYQAEADSTEQGGSAGGGGGTDLDWSVWGGGSGTGQTATSKRVKTRLEWYWLAHGLIKEITQLVHLYLDFIDRLEDKDYAFGALQNETVVVFYEEGKNALQVFQNTYDLVKENVEVKKSMTSKDCYDLGKQMTQETNRINRRLKWQMLRVERFDKTKVPNQVLTKIGERLSEGEPNRSTKSTFDPAEMNKQW